LCLGGEIPVQHRGSGNGRTFFMVNLLITDESNTEWQLEAFLNKDGRIAIVTGELQSEYHKGICTLSKDDAKALVKELNKLIKIMSCE